MLEDRSGPDVNPEDRPGERQLSKQWASKNRPADKPADETSSVRPADKPADETSSVRPAETPADGTSSVRPAETPADAPAEASKWALLVQDIRDGKEEAITSLYSTFGRGVRYSMCRALGTKDLDDRVHDTFVVVLQSILKGELREPERLMGFIRTVVRRQIASYIDEMVHNRRGEVELEAGGKVRDHRQDPERYASARERGQIMREALEAIAPRDREILTRFYLHEQTQDQICREMDLTENQFRLLKSRAKARFGEFGKKRVSRGSVRAFSLREKSA